MTRSSDIPCSDARARWLRCVDEGFLDADAMAHVEHCADCRAFACETSVVLERLSELKRATQTMGIEVAYSRTRSSTSPHRERHLIASQTFWRIAAAVVVLVAGSYFALRNREFVVVTSNPIAPEMVVESVAPPGVSIKLVGQSRNTYLAVADSSPSSNVDVIRLYPIAAQSLAAKNLESPSAIRIKENHQ